MPDTSRLLELEKALETKVGAIKDAASAFKIEDNGGVVVSPEQRDDYLKTINEAKEIRGLLQAERDVSDLDTWMNAPRTESVSGAIAADAQRGGRERKSIADHLIESESFQAQRKAASPHIKVEIEDSLFNLLEAETKDIYGTSAGRTGGDVTLPGLGRTQDIGITELRFRQRHVRDLFPTQTTNAPVLHGIRETGFTNNAAAVPVRSGGDFGLKPMSNLTLETITYQVATIAHLLRAHKNILDDEPRLRGFLDRRMIDGIKLAEDAALMYGTGAGESVQGIMNVPGVQSYTGQAADPLSAQLRRAATLAMISEYEPNGIVVHPTDWEDLELETTGTGEYRLAVNIAVGGQKRVWSMDLVTTTAINAGEFLLGAFGTGAELFDREAVGVLVSTEDSDNFRRNAITFRAEERVALVVDRPEAFVAGAFTPYVAP